MFQWVDYESEYAPLVNSWLDDDAIAMTGLDMGWDHYWEAVKEDAANFPGCQDFCKVILQDGVPCAAVCYGIYQNAMTVSEIVVAPNIRGQGIGTRLLTELIEIAREADVNSLTAIVYPRNLASQRAFRNAGFCLDGKTGDGFDLIFSHRF